VVLCVSRLVPKKGIDVLIDAFVPLARSHPDLLLEIAGSGPLLDALEARVHALDLGDRVRLLGRLTSDDVARAYQRCAMVVLPCRVDESGDRDGMPTVLVEALARGVPVISTDVAGVPELVRHGDTGLLVPPDDPHALAAAIGHLADDRAWAAQLGAAGRTLVRDEFDPTTSTARLRAVFASCAPGGVR
jgi:colanic acid/amylovoran biosynthesis glycosyltransferase